ELSGNEASAGGNGYGGAVYSSSAHVIVLNSTVAQNTASGGYGGGLAVDGAGVIDVTAATIASNVGSGIDLVDNVAVSLLNTILVGNTDDQCTVLGTGREDIISLGYNLSSDATCNLVHVTDRPSTALMLGALADNGGPTRTMALLAGSVAVDGGTCEKITTDQR